MAVFGRRASFLNNIIPLCVFLLIILMSANSSTDIITNVLKTGQILNRDTKLSYPNSNVSLVFEYDCNVLIYDYKGDVWWSSNTRGVFTNCTLSLSDNGRLVINVPGGHQRFITPDANSRVGKYVAILHPVGQLSIYGPAVWAEGEPSVKESSISTSNDINSNEMIFSMINLKDRPPINNVLFSGLKVYEDGKLSENGYNFILHGCELILRDSNGGVSWQTGTHRDSIHCFATLDYFGRLSIIDENGAVVVWKSEAAPRPLFGQYALVLHSDGTVYIYGPKIWSTGLIPRDGLTSKMPVVKI